MRPILGTAVRTTCPYCGVGCGVLASHAADGAVEIQGDPEHPANFGRLCAKGMALNETLGVRGRLLYPEMHGQRCTWEMALDTVARHFNDIIRRHGSQALAFYVSGQLLTEDYYVANKLMKGFIGTANIDTNSRLCMASSVVGHVRAFGADVVPGNYEDLEAATLLVLVGSNTAWCHPILFQRMMSAKERNPDLKIVTVDPRRTATAGAADLHLAIKPGTDALLFNGLLVYLQQQGDTNEVFVKHHTAFMDDALQAARQSAPDIQTVARGCGLTEEALAKFYRWFSCNEKVVTVYSQGVNQSTSGTDKVNAIINCHLLTGRIGRPGMGPFSFTGQPNAMGGREVGALATQLAAHMQFVPEDIARLSRFWGVKQVATAPGLKAVDLFRAIEDGKIKAVWIIATNPVVSLPDADRVKAALKRCEFVVASDCVRATDTNAYADILLPAQAWGEKNGTVTNSERRISRQRAFCKAPGQAKPDWWIMTQVAKRMGFRFHFDSPLDIFREHAALSGFENEGQRAFDISALASITPADYERLEPIRWPIRRHQATGTARLFGDGRFFTRDRKAHFVPILPRSPAQALDAAFPLALNTGRVRDHWHTLTRTALSPRLSAHTPEPYCEIHPADAAARGIENDTLVKIHSRHGEMVARARLSDEQRPGSVFIPIHWNDQHAACARVGSLVNPETDPFSGQPEFKHTPVQVAPYRCDWYGFILTRRLLSFTGFPCDRASPDAAAARTETGTTHWVRVTGKNFWRYELAGHYPTKDGHGGAHAWLNWARTLLSPKSGDTGDWIDYWDSAGADYRAACVVNNRLDSCVFIGPTPALPGREWLGKLFSKKALMERERANMLAGGILANEQSAGTIVCACFGVTRETLRNAIREGGMTSAKAVGQALQAGTNCGSCLPEINALLQRAAPTGSAPV